MPSRRELLEALERLLKGKDVSEAILDTVDSGVEPSFALALLAASLEWMYATGL